MRKILLLLAKGFEVYEASVFIDVFGWNKIYGTQDIELVTCGMTKNITSTFGVKIEVDHTINEINPTDFDALAIPGGFEIYDFYEDAYSKDFLDLIVQFDKSNKPIATICVGALPVGKSGLLKNKEATTYCLLGNERQKQLQDFGAKIVDYPIVKMENITTSIGPGTAIGVAFGLLTNLTNEENVKYIKSIMGFD